MLRKISFYSILLILLFISGIRTYAQFPRFKVLAFYSIHVEPDHVDFAWDAIRFFKDLTSGDGFVVWTNTDYRMIYMNMGHGDKIFSDATQNKLIISGIRWIVAADKKGNVFEK